MKEMETCYCVHAFALSVFAFFVSCPFSFTLLSYIPSCFFPPHPIHHVKGNRASQGFMIGITRTMCLQEVNVSMYSATRCTFFGL